MPSKSQFISIFCVNGEAYSSKLQPLDYKKWERKSIYSKTEIISTPVQGVEFWNLAVEF